MSSIFQSSLEPWLDHALQCLCTYNFWLILVWLLIYATCSFFPVGFLVDKGLAVARYLSLTEIGSLLRADLQVLTEHPYLLSFTFIVYGFLPMWLVEWYYHGVECAICCESYKWVDQPYDLPCGHNFHERCIKKWLHSYGHDNCPICRQLA